MEVAHQIQTWLYAGQPSITMLFVGIILLSYLLEDLAIVTAATLAVQDLMPASVALMAIFVGIATGDLGLYLLGKLAQRLRFLRYRLFQYQRVRQVKKKLHQRAFVTLFVVRFIPGLRTVGFTLSGFLDVPVMRFLVAVMGATALWTALIFGSFYQLGSAAWLQQSPFSWLLIPAGLGLMWLLNKMIRKTFLRGTYDTAR
ncbi:DedA family protein [Vibrio ostreicida]|uniref:DedA family protein n=1 Tax=Vibrio ostreicida TaxID=526588 RepID=A0ABT8BZG2_9VIBR|nr:DedA family protein [Vibrio ostreicida]MDN3612222.1 DedA family protein [Vibrio ostreicida]NPD08612.1 DedA family protein [Vibrio ostreicida]